MKRASDNLQFKKKTHRMGEGAALKQLISYIPTCSVQQASEGFWFCG